MTAGRTILNNDAATASGSESTKTVAIAFGANLVVAVAKTVAGFVSGSVSMAAEAAHSWADTGNQLFLMIANWRSDKKADRQHPLGYGREAYVWSLLAAVGLFVVGPRQLFVVASVDLVGEEVESRIAHTLRKRERTLEANPHIVDVVLTIAEPSELDDANRR